MAKQDIQTIIGSSISKDEALLKNFKSIKSCFVGWVESYNETSGTVNVQPAIQDFISNDEQSGNNYRNSPLLVNVWVLGTFKSTAIEKGDKAVCFVLDQKSNDFFKCIYDSGISLGFQTFKPKTSAQKNICDCVCLILGDASFQELYKAVSAIDMALENKADIDGTYPDMTVGNATNAENSSQLGGVNAESYAQLSQVVRTDTDTNISETEQKTARENINAWGLNPNKIPVSVANGWTKTQLGDNLTGLQNGTYLICLASVNGSTFSFPPYGINIHKQFSEDILILPKTDGYFKIKMLTAGTVVSLITETGAATNATSADLWYINI